MRLAIRWMLLFLLLAAAAGAPASPAGTRPVARVSLAGREYVRVSEWGDANGLELRWLKREETLQLSGGGFRVVLEVHSPLAQINGVQVRLLFPLVARDQVVFISQADVQHTFQPVFDPPRRPASPSLRTICLDAGHGGNDPGFCVAGNQEKRYTLLLAQELRDQLKRAGFKVSLTRSRDTSIEPAVRPILAKRARADLFVSLHFNSAGPSGQGVQGSEVYCLTPAGAPSTNNRGPGGSESWCAGNYHNHHNMYLAYQLQKTITRSLGTEDRGVHRARFAVLRDATMPAVLIEAGFMSHPVEGRKIFSAGYRQQIAEAIVEGLLAYKRSVEHSDAGLARRG